MASKLNDFEIIPFPGRPNEYFIGIDPYGYDSRVAVCCVMKKEVDNDHPEVIVLHTGRPDADFKAQVQQLVDFYKISSESILIT